MKAVIESKKYLPYEPDYAVPPGRTLLETLEHREIDQHELAQRIGVSAKHVNQIIVGNASITFETALKLESATGVPARFWNNLERNFQERRARVVQRTRLAADLNWLECIPTKELADRRAIKPTSNPVEFLERVLAFFGVADVEAWRRIWTEPRFSFRQSPAFKARPGPLAAWLRLGQVEAHRLQCEPYSPTRFKTALVEIRGLTLKDPKVFVPRMVDLCATSGVALALIPEMAGAPVSGAAQWITPDKAMICLNLRGKTNDKFWFNFFHEACHVLKHGKKQPFLDVGPSKRGDLLEQEADRFASETLIPSQKAGEVVAITSEAEVQMLAKSLGVHPGIVVGRFQYETRRFTHFNHLKLKLAWAEPKS